MEGGNPKRDDLNGSVECDEMASVHSDQSIDNDDGDENNAGENKTKDIVAKIAQRETNFVKYLRLGLFSTLLIAATIVAISVYLYTRGQEVDEFENSFMSFSSKLTEQFQSIADRRLGSIAAFSKSITAYTLAENITWPFVTIPKFEAQARYFAKLANVDGMNFSPIVDRESRLEWEAVYFSPNFEANQVETKELYALFNPLGTNATLSAVASSSNTSGPPEYYEGMPDFSRGYSSQIYTLVPTPDGKPKTFVATGAGPFLPWWQTWDNDQVARGKPNLDLNIDPSFTGDLVSILLEGKAALGKIATSGYAREYGNSPLSGFYYPVFKNFSLDSPVVGALGTLVNWIPFFSNVLPQTAVGLIGVLSSTCDQLFTFQVNGPEVIYLGEGDKHDPKYEYLQQEVSFKSLIETSIADKNYLGLPLNDRGCQYTLNVYASSEMEEQYMSNRPLIFTLVGLIIFLVTSFFFLLYDRIVERRQRLVMNEAEKSGAIVSSLFPAAYLDRLMAAQAKQNEMKIGALTVKGSKDNLLRSFLAGETVGNQTVDDQPIADNFPDCTVMFADIAGFTHWSSTREPAQVFCLLQEVYGGFDVLAKRYNVFKVETIGDCYMAVTGLPDPQPDHARLMARFASTCLLDMHSTTRRLSSNLGDDTMELALRIGLHSGPVTAGILRGEKSRFQLFGDSVNTASRMESLGKKNQIQVSETTAEHIRKAGKGYWLSRRDDLVEAKGKGKLQTYWLHVDQSRSTVSNTLTSASS